MFSDAAVLHRMFLLLLVCAFFNVMGGITARPTTTSAEIDHSNLETPARNRVYPALEVRFMDSLSSSSYRKYPTTQSKRNCKYNLGLSQDCDYRNFYNAYDFVSNAYDVLIMGKHLVMYNIQLLRQTTVTVFSYGCSPGCIKKKIRPEQLKPRKKVKDLHNIGVTFSLS